MEYKKAIKKAGGTSKAPVAHGVGRRKAAIARVWLRRGSGAIEVNGKDFGKYFDTDIARISVQLPFKVYVHSGNYDAMVNVYGGGLRAQADAVKLGIARAINQLDEAAHALLRQEGLLTVDDRVKERKKYGRKAARRRFQFVKR